MVSRAVCDTQRPAIANRRLRADNILQQHQLIIGGHAGRATIGQSDGRNRRAIALKINRRIAFGFNAARAAIGYGDRIGPNIGDANGVMALNGGGRTGGRCADGNRAAIGNRQRRAVSIEKNRAATIGIAIGQRIADR